MRSRGVPPQLADGSLEGLFRDAGLMGSGLEVCQGGGGAVKGIQVTGQRKQLGGLRVGEATVERVGR
jgi:hypothetical protein